MDLFLPLYRKNLKLEFFDTSSSGISGTLLSSVDKAETWVEITKNDTV